MSSFKMHQKWKMGSLKMQQFSKMSSFKMQQGEKQIQDHFFSSDSLVSLQTIKFAFCHRFVQHRPNFDCWKLMDIVSTTS